MWEREALTRIPLLAFWDTVWAGLQEELSKLWNSKTQTQTTTSTLPGKHGVTGQWVPEGGLLDPWEAWCIQDC